jgi:NADPH-dependent 2,4-dienoyl-CoA reductase/sulfur reductase-like enzyme
VDRQSFIVSKHDPRIDTNQYEPVKCLAELGMYDLIIIGAGPGGIALAAEATASGVHESQVLVLESGW